MRRIRAIKKPGILDESLTPQNLVLGISIGSGLGIITGIALQNLALGISLGVALGLSIGMLIDSLSKK